MASMPAEHQLFQGSAGAVKWLKRFLQQLPVPPQAPLPLLTAPVLDAFLTGAGHMLANCYGEEFRELFGLIEKDVLPRLDEGTIGAPSAIRLRKTTKDGFDGFRDNLPARALNDLYHANQGQGAFQPPPSKSTAPNPFAVGASGGTSTAINFGGQSSAGFSSSASNSTSNFSAPSPFGTSKGPDDATNVFNSNRGSTFKGVPNSQTQASPFGNAGPLASPFGGFAASAPSPFTSASSNSMKTGSAAAGVSPSPFGSSAPGSSPFGSAVLGTLPSGAHAPGQPSSSQNSFGTGNVSSPSPFGVSTAPGLSSFAVNPPGPSPFGNSAQAAAPIASMPSNFGNATSAQSPFGSTAPVPASTPFSTGQNPFGNSAATGASPFGGSRSSTSLFGGSAAPAPTPFGSAGGPPSPFGFTNRDVTQFGGSGMASPFGSTAAPSPSLFGTFSTAATSTPFSSNNNQPQFGGSNKQPCKYFAKGQCRYGNSCKYSHSINPASTSFSSPFGGPPRR